MQKYQQYCPVARASEILAERWTPLIVRELVAGSHRFNEIERALPGVSLTGYVLVYAICLGFGTFYIYKLLREGPIGRAEAIPNTTASRPLAFADTAASATGSQPAARG